MDNENVQANESTSITPTPGPDPSAFVPQASPPASEAVDPSISLNQQLQSTFGMNADEIRNLKSGMNEAQRKAAAAEKSLRNVAPILEYSQRDPNFMPYLFEKANEYGQPSGQGNLDPAVLGALDPIQRDLRELREERAAEKFHGQMNTLAKDFPEIMTAEEKRELALEAEASGNYNLDYIFFQKHGKALIAKARQTGTQDAVKQIQQNNALYQSGATTTAVAAMSLPDFSKMSKDETQAWINKDTEKIWTDPDYAAKVAREIG